MSAARPAEEGLAGSSTSRTHSRRLRSSAHVCGYRAEGGGPGEGYEDAPHEKLQGGVPPRDMTGRGARSSPRKVAKALISRSSDKACLGAERTAARGTFSGRELHPEGFPSVNEAPRRKHQRSPWRSSWEGRGPCRAAPRVRSKLQRQPHSGLLVSSQNHAMKSREGSTPMSTSAFRPRDGGSPAP